MFTLTWLPFAYEMKWALFDVDSSSTLLIRVLMESVKIDYSFNFIVWEEKDSVLILDWWGLACCIFRVQNQWRKEMKIIG